MTCWSRLRLEPRKRQPFRLIRPIAVGLVVVAGALGLSRVFPADGPAGPAAGPDRGMTFKISGPQDEMNLDETQAPPRPPVKEEADRSGAYPRLLSPRPDLTPTRHSSPPPARPASPARIQPPSALDAVPELPSPVLDNRRQGQTQAAEPRDAGLGIQQPQRIVREARVWRGPATDLGTPDVTTAKTTPLRQPDSVGLDAVPVLPRSPLLDNGRQRQTPAAESRDAGLGIQQPQGIAEETRVWRDPATGQRTPAGMPSETAATNRPDSVGLDPLPVLPRSPVLDNGRQGQTPVAKPGTPVWESSSRRGLLKRRGCGGIRRPVRGRPRRPRQQTSLMRRRRRPCSRGRRRLPTNNPPSSRHSKRRKSVRRKSKRRRCKSRR
jgi:hypothetical protein